MLGKVRAKQDQLNDGIERSKALPLLIHGDAAFAGQGVVAECFGLSGLRGHRTGGSLHFIVNNQIGFTTYPRYSRSSPYPSDVAKLVEAPIFHVNGDDPEAVVFCAKVAIEYRQKFHKPVVIDMFCYRRFGHNEGDEPSFTQPIMYRLIRSHPTTQQIYANKLIAEGVVTQGEVDKMRSDWRATAGGGIRGRPILFGQQGRLARRPLGGRQGGAGDRRRRSPRQDWRRVSIDSVRSASASPRRLKASTFIKPLLAFSKTAARQSRSARGSTGRPPRRSPSARFWTRAFRFACPARTASGARSRSAIRC